MALRIVLRAVALFDTLNQGDVSPDLPHGIFGNLGGELSDFPFDIVFPYPPDIYRAIRISQATAKFWESLCIVGNRYISDALNYVLADHWGGWNEGHEDVFLCRKGLEIVNTRPEGTRQDTHELAHGGMAVGDLYIG